MTMGIAALCAIAAVGCGSSRDGAWENHPDPAAEANQSQEAADQRASLISEGETAWGSRQDEVSLESAIQKWEAAAEMDGSDPEIWVRLARAYYFYADGHMSFDEARTEEMVSTYEKGIQAAERALVALSPDFAQRMRAGTRIEEAITILDGSAVPALYWRSSNMGKWGIAKGFATILSYKDEIRAIMARCMELDATYFYHGPPRYFGAYYAKVPAYAGGDLDQSRQNFEQALAAAPDYLGTRTLMAQMYAVKAQDRAIFDEQLNAVISANVDDLDPAIRPENLIEQRRARVLLEQADELFE